MNIFDILKDIIKDKTGKLDQEEEFGRSFNCYMICRYLSMDYRFIEIADIANKLQTTLSSEQLYRFLIKMIPQSDKTWIHYISKNKK